METLLLWVLVVVLVVAGFLGLLLPVLPGAPLLFAGLLIAAWIEDFAYVGPWTASGLSRPFFHEPMILCPAAIATRSEKTIPYAHSGRLIASPVRARR